MSDNLLAKENEFHRLNHDLQLKTRDVMETVNLIIHTHADKNLFNGANQLLPNLIEDAKTIHSKDVAPKVMENKVIITLLKGKIDTLYKKLQVMQLEYNNKCDYYKELEMEKKKLDDIQLKLCKEIETLNNTIMKLNHVNSDTLSDYQVLSNENIVLKKDLENLRKEIRILNQQSINLDTRLNRSLECNEKLRNALKYSQIEEKELRNEIIKLQADKKLAIKNLEKLRSELMQAFKKQTLLVDNLKKQNIYLMANGQISLMREDFAKLLE